MTSTNVKVKLLQEWAEAERSAIVAELEVRHATAEHNGQQGNVEPAAELLGNARRRREHADRLLEELRTILRRT